jgi:hypothetical protein
LKINCTIDHRPKGGNPGGGQKIEIYLNNEFNYCTPSPRNETVFTKLPLKNSVADFENGPIAAPLKPKVIIV